MNGRVRTAVAVIGGGVLSFYLLGASLFSLGGLGLTVALAVLLTIQALYSRFCKTQMYVQSALDMVFTAALGILALNLVARAVYRINWDHGFFFEPNFVTIIESRELLKATLFGHFRSVYTAMDGYPYLITLYPPLFHAMTKVSTWVFGPTLIAGRVVSLISFLGLLGAVGGITFRITRNAWLAVMVVGVTLITPQVADWSVIGRPDILAWMLAFSSVCLLTPPKQGITSRKTFALAALAMCFSLLTKEQTLPFFIGCSVYAFLAHPNKREMICWYVVPVTVGVGCAYLSINFYTNGHFFLNVLTYPSLLASNDEFNKLSTFLRNSKVLLITVYPALLSFCAYAFFRFYSLKADLISILFFVNLPFHILLLRSWGYDYNYDISAILCIFCGTAGFAGLFRGSALFLGASALVFSLLMLPYDNYATLLKPATYALELPRPSDKITNHRLNQQVVGEIFKKSNGIALVDAESSYLVLAHDKGTVKYIDAVESGVYANIKGWDPEHSLIAQDIRNGRFAFIIVSKALHQALKDAIDHVYAPILEVGNSTIYTVK